MTQPTVDSAEKYVVLEKSASMACVPPGQVVLIAMEEPPILPPISLIAANARMLVPQIKPVRMGHVRITRSA